MKKNQLIKATDVAQFETPRNDAVAFAESLTITTPSQYQTAIEECIVIKRLEKKIYATFEPMRQTAKAAYDQVLKQRNEFLNPLHQAEATIKSKLTEYQAIEAERREREAQAAREAAEKKREEDFQELREAGLLDDPKAEAAALAEPIKIEVLAEPVKVAGHSVSRSWKVVVDHPHLVSREFCSPDQSKLDAHAKAHDGECEIVGCRVVPVTTQRIST